MQPMFHKLLIALRILFVTVGALALLFVLSFPDSIIPAHPMYEYMEGITAMDVKPWIWLAPLLAMEFFDVLGPRRNLVWFTSLFAVLLAGFIAWPVIESSYPEWLYPTFAYEDGKLSAGLGWLAAITFGSILFRGVLLAFLCRAPERSDDSELNSVDSAVLDPAKARTVREIAAAPVRVKPRFLFGEADLGLIERFGVFMRRLVFRHRVRSALFIAAAALLLGWFCFYPRPDAQQALQRDLLRMQEYVRRPDGSLRATIPAVHAAYRVMRYVSDHESFAGFSREQAEKWLGLDQLPNPAYRALLRDETDRPLASVDDAFESRTRFLTVTDGIRTAVLFIRTNEQGDVINISEVQDAGWNAVADDLRRRFGNDIDTRILSR